VAWELKNIFLIHFEDALVPLLIKDHMLPPLLHSSTTTFPRILPLLIFSPPTPKTDDRACTRISRRTLGRYIMLNAPHYGRSSV
jgi:hypothetical protein